MTIDIRADVYCSLGPVISGSFSDDYIQDSGLIKTRGEVLLKGIYRPEIGTVVEFAYIRSGIASRLPRKLRVLSVFSDPYRGTTNIALGCRLSYLEGRKPPIKNPTSVDENGETPPDVIATASLPISAAYVFEQCLAELGLIADQNPLTNKFSVEEFALDSGYIQVMSDLLKSEGYFGYINEEEVLTVKSINIEGGFGPVVGIDEIIDISPIDVGELPGDTVIANYSYLKLQPPTTDVTQNEFGAFVRDYTSSSTVGSEVQLEVTGTYKPDPNSPGEEITVTGSYTPVASTTQTYELMSVEDPETGQSSKQWLMITETQSSNGHYLEGASSINSGYIQARGDVLASGTFTKSSVKTFTYDSTGRAIQESVVETGPQLLVYAAVPVPWGEYFTKPASGALGYFDWTLASSITTTKYDDAKDVTVVTTMNSKPKGFTSEGQNEFARRIERYTELGNWGVGEIGVMLAQSLIMTFDSSSIATNVGRGEIDTGSAASSTVPDGPLVQADTAGIEWINGSAESQLVIQFSVPYSGDDYLTDVSGSGPTLEFTIVPSDAPTKARNYGNLQNRLLLGNRNGLSIQVSANSMPIEPFSPMYIEANGLIAEFRTNGTSYTFDANGMVASTDALFWGGVGES
jgi:hypothetical protein